VSSAEPRVPGPEEAIPGRLDVRRAIRLLPERDRELLALRYGADLSAKEIGTLVDMRTNAVEVALHEVGFPARRARGHEGGPARRA
jgi:DNA-directed RNA polymerase specialized sigma24 family protein